MNIPLPKPEIINDADLYLSFQLMKRQDFAGAENRILAGLKKANKQKDTTLEGLYFSALGILYKLKKDFKKSYKFYQQAERLLPDDNSVKIITAILLIEEFDQFDLAIRKLERVIENEQQDAAMLHHAKAVQGIAYFKKGNKTKAKENFEFLLVQDFKNLRSVSNVDFKLVQLFLTKSFEKSLCSSYLNKALQLAQFTHEKVYETVIHKLIGQLPVVVP